MWGTSREVSRLPQHPALHPVVLDLANPESVRTAFATSLAEAGHFDVLINNAGSGHFDPIETLSAELVQAQFQTLVFAQLALCQLALAEMRGHGDGLIINVTSLAARLPVPFMSAYNAAKAAMAAFTMSLQLELEGTRIRVVDVQPGDIRTAFNDVIGPGRQPARANPSRVAAAWRIVDRNLKNAPAPELVARRILALIEQNPPPPQVTVGDAFQSRIAPAIFRLLPQSVRIWGLRKYYKL